MKSNRRARFPHLWILILMTAAACAGGDRITESESEPSAEADPVVLAEPGEPERDERSGEPGAIPESEEQILLVRNRSRLQDAFAVYSNDPPERHFHSFDERVSDPYQGFRIQILSTRDVSLADTTRADFEDWAQERFAEYIPHSYIHYRQPFYRVRIGDFQDRERAIELSRLIQQRYPDAWIIHDRIQPNRVASDTTRFRFRDPADPPLIAPMPEEIDYREILSEPGLEPVD